MATAYPSDRAPRRRCRGASAPLAAVLLAVLLQGCAAVDRAHLFLEERAVRQAAVDYLDAEVKQDRRAVFACLAPSSPYRQANTYETYLAEVERSPVRVVAYRIVAVSDIRDNDDRVRFPRVERFARVEVEIEVVCDAAGHRAEMNNAFTFLKEQGRWYKG